MTVHFDWTRYWVERDGSMRVHEGFLADPGDPDDPFSPNPQLVTTDGLLNARCAVMLGEPGMGKSTELRAHYEALQIAGEAVEMMDLLEYGDEGRLVEDLDEKLSSLQLAGKPHLLLDSLDECRRRIPNVGLIVTQRLRRPGNEKLKLRLACRTGDWLDSLEDGLLGLFTDISVRELAPLRKQDVGVACSAGGVDTNEFLAAVTAEGLQVFASRPWTLKLLLTEFASSGARRTQLEVFDRAIELLLEEQNPQRFDVRAREMSSLARRKSVAAHLALIWVLTDSRSFRTGPEAETGPEDLTMSTVPLILTGGERIGEAEIRDVLSSALFSARGRRRMGWADRSFAEYLAARQLADLDLPVAQLENLFFDRGRADGRLFPQVRELAGWLIAMKPARLRHWIDSDPLGVVLAAVRLPEAELRQQLVESLFRWTDEGRLMRWLRVELRHLAHPTLGTQLRDRILDRSTPEATRSLAIDLAEACQVTDLTEALASIATNPDEDLPLRINAAYAVTRVADPNQRALLLPLATEAQEGDDDLELKGLGLIACWPDHLTGDQVFDLLAPTPDLVGAYWRFITHVFPQTLTADHLDRALRFAASPEPGHYEELIDAIVQLAWDHVEEDGIAALLAQLMLERGRQYEPFFISRRRGSQAAPDDQSKRHLLVEAMIEAPNNSDSEGFHIADSRLSLVGANDFEWLVETVAKWQGSDKESTASYVAARAFDPMSQRHVDIAWKVDRASALWTDHLASWFRAIEIDSEQAERLRSIYERSAAHQGVESAEDSEQTAGELRARISALLSEITQGAAGRFWELNQLLLVHPDTGRYESEFELNLTATPGWQLLGDEQRSQVIDAAKAYLSSEGAQPERWLGTNIIWRPAVAGYRALVLLLEFDPEFVRDLSPQAWAEWAPVVVWSPEPEALIVTDDDSGTNRWKLELLEFANAKASEQVLGAFRVLLDASAADPDLWFSQDRSLKHIWDDNIADLVGESLGKDLPRLMGRQLLDLIMNRAPSAGSALLGERLSHRAESEGQRERALDAAVSALRHQLEAAWPDVWNAIAADLAFGIELVLSAAERFERPPIVVDTIGEAAVGEFAVWLFEHFPPEDDLEVHGVHVVGSREQVSKWREAIVTDLVSAGTAEAVQAVDALSGAFPEYAWLRNQVLEAELVALRANWIPLDADAASRLLGESDFRVVQNPDQLQRVVVESLERLATRLQGALPEVVFLWDEREKRPKSEARFSDYVTRFLRDDLIGRGVVTNREVEVRNWRGRGIGERTDILVEAPGPDTTARLVIEVKGCWNDGLYVDLVGQLWERYMSEWETRNGVYLIPMVAHSEWDVEQQRAYGCPDDYEAMISRLVQQAAELSATGASIEVVPLQCAMGDVA